MEKSVWVFSPLSCSLMSLLASRTHEWQSWTITEGGEGVILPSNVTWVELALNVADKVTVVRTSNLHQARAIDLLKQARIESEYLGPPLGESCSLIWESDKFLSELSTADFPNAPKNASWMLCRGSKIKPKLYVQKT